MSERYISNIIFDDKLDKSSYLNGLPVIKHLKENGKLQKQITKQEAIIYQLKLSLNKDTGNHIPFID